MKCYLIEAFFKLDLFFFLGLEEILNFQSYT